MCSILTFFFKKKERKKIIIVSCVDFNFYFLYVNARKKKKQEAKKKVKVTECFYALQGVKCANTVKQNKNICQSVRSMNNYRVLRSHFKHDIKH